MRASRSGSAGTAITSGQADNPYGGMTAVMVMVMGTVFTVSGTGYNGYRGSGGRRIRGFKVQKKTLCTVKRIYH